MITFLSWLILSRLPRWTHSVSLAILFPLWVVETLMAAGAVALCGRGDFVQTVRMALGFYPLILRTGAYIVWNGRNPFED